jgi:hypothetical protein
MVGVFFSMGSSFRSGVFRLLLPDIRIKNHLLAMIAVMAAQGKPPKPAMGVFNNAAAAENIHKAALYAARPPAEAGTVASGKGSGLHFLSAPGTKHGNRSFLHSSLSEQIVGRKEREIQDKA